MNKKKYITPVIVIEKMELPDLMLVVSDTEVKSAAYGYTLKNESGPMIGSGITKQEAVGSKESDWSFDYSLDIDW